MMLRDAILTLLFFHAARGSSSVAAPWAVVTGASSGIGRAIAAEFSSRGNNVVLVARRRQVLQTGCEALERAHGVDCVALALDLGKPGGAVKLEKATRHLKGLQVLVANAGVPWTGPAVEQPVESLENMLELNVAQLAMMCRLFGARFAAQGVGGLLLTSSLTAYASLPMAAAYAASRAFVSSLAGGLRSELEPFGVAVTCLLPGATDTEFASRGEIEGAMIFNFPLARRLGLVQSAAAVAAVGVDALAAGEPTAIPGLLNGAYCTQAGLMPPGLAAAFSAACFGAASPLASPSALLGAPDG